MRIFIFILIFAFIDLSARGNDNLLTDNWKFMGYAQIVPYLDGRDFSKKTYPLTHTAMKTRFGVNKKVSNIFEFNFHVQDSRIWGQESGLTSNSKNIDMIIGYLQFNDLLDLPVDIQFGRFQLIYGNSRFLGNSPWNYYERAYDGIRCMVNTEDIDCDVFYANTGNEIVKPVKALPDTYKYPSTEYLDRSMLGFWATLKQIKDQKFHLFLYRELNPAKTNNVDFDLDRSTIGINWFGKFGNISPNIEFAYQFGGISDINISAYIFSIYTDHKMGDWQFTAGTDWLSGTPHDADNEFGTYQLDLGAKHKFFGLMDYFQSPSEATKERGVNDIYLGATFGRQDTKWNYYLFAHLLMANQKYPDGNNIFGEEIDLRIRYFPVEGVFIEFTNGVFLPGNIMKDFYRTESGEMRSDPGFISYLRFVANI